MTDLARTVLLGFDQAELRSLMEEMGEPAYRAKQIAEAVYRQRVEFGRSDFNFVAVAAVETGRERLLHRAADD